MIDPLSYKEHKDFHEQIIEQFELEYARALNSGCFPDMKPGDHTIARIVLKNVTEVFAPLSARQKELAKEYEQF